MVWETEYVAFVEANWGRYLRLARLLTGDRDRGEELLQECLVRLYVRWRRAATRDPHAYLRRMLVNGNISWWRLRRREYLRADPPDRADPQAEPPNLDDSVRAALLALPAGQRAVVVLRYCEDLTEREVARALGCTVGTVKSQNARGLRRLRELLTGFHDKEKVNTP
ncbi:SigE family RNA polymerase sigma factor [Jidongwangia harbinensis]|uniref:SigE family RNA polymerase sigma factor n=1 Tax=Jidongwangia harbinensis TaxID=2878561 RepID=UPI001CD9B3BE|nr:SigE family RNA polymerase sigma factor [Jidongwangia harbinensis]MCA2217661.1 SigE family RNA polymerase sigma factor [Jidongwangia harbinensis]